MTDYYDINLKMARQSFYVKILISIIMLACFRSKLLDEIYLNHKPNIIIHLAAQAGVRYSIENPSSYIGLI